MYINMILTSQLQALGIGGKKLNCCIGLEKVNNVFIISVNFHSTFQCIGCLEQAVVAEGSLQGVLMLSCYKGPDIELHQFSSISRQLQRVCCHNYGWYMGRFIDPKFGKS
jgi:hypothetical protein